MVTPADVPMLHKIEASIGRKLEAHSSPIDDVLYHLSETSSAKEVAEMFLEHAHFVEERRHKKEPKK